MNYKLTYNRLVSLKLYKPVFKKRCIVSIILFFMPFFFVLVNGLIRNIFKINTDILKHLMLGLDVILVSISIPFIILNFTWYFTKKNSCKHNYIQINDIGIEYYYEQKGGLKAVGISKYLLQINTINKIEENWEKITITGSIKKNYVGARNGYYETVNYIEIPKVFSDIERFLDYAKSKIEK